MWTLDQRLDWLGGIIDGEGTFTATLRKGGHQGWLTPRFIVANTNEALMLEVQSILDAIGVPSYLRYYVPPNKPRVKPSWWIEVKGKDRLERLLVELESRLVAKGPQAELLIRLIRRRREIAVGRSMHYTKVPIDQDSEIVECVGRIHELNRRGVVPDESITGS